MSARASHPVLAGPVLAGLACVAPPGVISAEDYAEFCARRSGGAEREKTVLRRVVRQTRIESRHSAVVEGAGIPFFEAEAAPSTALRMRRFEHDAPELAVRAARESLARAGVAADSITHLVTVTCTGFAAPGFDRALFDALPLRNEVERVQVGFMGCHGAINGLRAAEAFARLRPGARALLVCLEFCSLHFQTSQRREDLIPNALFADGAAALVVCGEDFEARSGARLIATASHLIPGTADAMSWRIGDEGFRMTLDTAVPDLIARAIAPAADAFLARHGLARRDVAGWLIHPGGPRILDAALAALGLPPEAGAPSARVLASHGNMSSPTILFILENYLTHAHAPGPALMIAFGPGLVMEMALVDIGP